jgi:hypothetical protein
VLGGPTRIALLLHTVEALAGVERFDEATWDRLAAAAS